MDSTAACIFANYRLKRASLRVRCWDKLWSRTKPDQRAAWSTKCWWRNRPRSRAKFTLRFCSIAQQPARSSWPARKVVLKSKLWRRSRLRKLFASRSIRWPACNRFRHANWRSSWHLIRRSLKPHQNCSTGYFARLSDLIAQWLKSIRWS